MATDRYSDDYKIVVTAGSGTMTVDADLEITGSLSFTGSLSIPGDLDVSGSVTATDLNLSGSGTSSIASAAGSIDITAYSNLDITSGSNIGIVAQGDLGIYSSAGTIEISPAGPPVASVFPSVYITLSEADDETVIGGPTLTISADTLSVTSGTIELDSEITYPTTREVHLAVPYIAFSRDDTLNSVTSVTTTSLGLIDINGSGGTSGGVAYLNVPLPDSIPDGSEITAIWGGFRWSAAASSVAQVDIQYKECQIGSSENYTNAASDSKTVANDSNYHFTSFSINKVVNKSYANMIAVVVTLPSTQNFYFYGIRITYQTGRVDLNVSI